MGECQGHEACHAEAFLCQCGVMCCVAHGHVEAGDDPDCPNLRGDDEPTDEGPRVEDIDLSRWETHDDG